MIGVPDVSRIAIRRIQLVQARRTGGGRGWPTEPGGQRFMLRIVELLIAEKDYPVPDQRGTNGGYRAIVSIRGKCDAANFGADSTACRLNIEWALRVGHIDIGLL